MDTRRQAKTGNAALARYATVFGCRWRKKARARFCLPRRLGLALGLQPTRRRAIWVAARPALPYSFAVRVDRRIGNLFAARIITAARARRCGAVHARCATRRWVGCSGHGAGLKAMRSHSPCRQRNPTGRAMLSPTRTCESTSLATRFLDYGPSDLRSE